MWPLVVVPLKPPRQVGVSGVGGPVGDCIGPFAQDGLDEAFGLSVCLRRVGPGSDVTYLQAPETLGEQARDVTRAVVGHDALDRHTASLEPSQSSDGESDGRRLFLVG